MAVDPSTVQGLAYSDPFAVFFTSEYFLITLVLIVVTCITTPFAVKGAIEVGKWMDRHFIKPGAGYIEARQRMPNDRVRNFWLLPTGKMAKYRTIDGKEIEQSINLGKGWVVFDGNVPVIELDQHGHQVYLGDNKYTPKGGISQEEITRGYKAAYDTGKLMGAVDFFDEVKQWLLITIVIVAVMGMINAYFGFTVMGMIDKQIHPSTTDIAQEVVIQMRNATFIQQSGAAPSTPTVGGA